MLAPVASYLNAIFFYLSEILKFFIVSSKRNCQLLKGRRQSEIKEFEGACSDWHVYVLINDCDCLTIIIYLSDRPSDQQTGGQSAASCLPFTNLYGS